MIKFNKYNVRDTKTGKKARVRYSIDNRVDKKKCVTIYAKDYTNDLHELFPSNYSNNTDIMTDYFERGCSLSSAFSSFYWLWLPYRYTADSWGI
jgi:hypothetical protein